MIKTKVIKGLGNGCDEEAERLVKMFKFKVDKTRKVRVIFHKSIQINFKLPKKKPAKTVRKQSVSLKYSVSSKKEAPKEEASKSYSYSIKIR